MKLIAAVDKKWGIGNKGKMLAHLPADLNRFKGLTKNKVVVMGRKTYESLPKKPLPDRINIILTRDKTYAHDNVIIINNKEALFKILKEYESDDIFIAGGEKLYNMFLDLCDKALITKIDNVFEADAFFPDLDNDTNWKTAGQTEIIKDGGFNTHYAEYINLRL